MDGFTACPDSFRPDSSPSFEESIKKGNTIKTIFASGPSISLRLLVLGALAASLMVVDHKTELLAPAKSFIISLATPLYWAADAPADIGEIAESQLKSRSTLIKENAALQAQAKVLQAKLLKLVSVQAENTRLRALLNSSERVSESVIIAEIEQVSNTASRHEFLINLGEKQGIQKGQAVLDAKGLVGQVTEVYASKSRVLMISDNTHAVPIVVSRNGVRGILEGSDVLDTLMLQNIAATTDIKEGDLLVTSGLGQRFPVGYPVAEVFSVKHDPGQPFLEIVARPLAALDRLAYVLVVFQQQEIPVAVTEEEP